MMNYNSLDTRTIRERVDLAQLWQAWIAADDVRRHSFSGALAWEVQKGHEYLYRRKRGIANSLGPRSPQSEAIHQAFHEGRAANKARLASLSAEIDRQAAVLRSLNAGRLPLMAARTLRALRTHDKHAGVRVIGTTALYAYETLAGVTFNAASTATGDVDLLVDDRNRLRLLTDDEKPIGLTRLVQASVDKTFTARGTMDFRLTNDKGYMVEFVRPEPRPIFRPMPGSEPLEEGDIRPAPVIGLHWLVNAPVVEVIVPDERGFPAPMRCADPRYWAVHKFWLAMRTDRDPPKKLRDRQQADVMLRLIADKLPQYPLDEGFLGLLPKELRAAIPLQIAASNIQPDW
jgi:hypothetical protein